MPAISIGIAIAGCTILALALRDLGREALVAEKPGLMPVREV